MTLEYGIGYFATRAATCFLAEELRRMALQQQIELGGLLQLLDRVDRGFERGAGDDRPVIGEQDGGMLRATAPTASAKVGSPGREIGQQLQLADPPSRNRR
jgi:hypothetical protein